MNPAYTQKQPDKTLRLRKVILLIELLIVAFVVVSAPTIIIADQYLTPALKHGLITLVLIIAIGSMGGIVRSNQ